MATDGQTTNLQWALLTGALVLLFLLAFFDPLGWGQGLF